MLQGMVVAGKVEGNTMRLELVVPRAGSCMTLVWLLRRFDSVRKVKHGRRESREKVTRTRTRHPFPWLRAWRLDAKELFCTAYCNCVRRYCAGQVGPII